MVLYVSKIKYETRFSRRNVLDSARRQEAGETRKRAACSNSTPVLDDLRHACELQATSIPFAGITRGVSAGGPHAGASPLVV